VESRYISKHQVVQGAFRGDVRAFALVSSHENVATEEEFEELSLDQRPAVQSFWTVDWDTEIVLLPQDTLQVHSKPLESWSSDDDALEAQGV
jgi:hypothetical protein